MSIYNLPPLETQTPERTLPSGEASNAIDVRERLGTVGARHVFDDQMPTEPLSYLPTHETWQHLQDGINYLHSVVFVELGYELAEVAGEINRVEHEITSWMERQRALEEHKADLGLFGSVPHKIDEDHQKAAQVIRALERAKNELYELHQDLIEKRIAAMAELEELEQADFELLERG